MFTEISSVEVIQKLAVWAVIVLCIKQPCIISSSFNSRQNGIRTDWRDRNVLFLSKTQAL